MRKRVFAIALGIAAALAVVPVAASANDRPGGGSCAKKFDAAQRADMTSFRDYDATTFRAGHDRNAVSIFPQGQRFVGVDAIMTALHGHFTDKEAVWSWTELNRRVDGCRSAFIEYDASYDIPRVGFHQRALTVVSYIFEHGKWLGVMDQGTLLELVNG